MQGRDGEGWGGTGSFMGPCRGGEDAQLSHPQAGQSEGRGGLPAGKEAALVSACALQGAGRVGSKRGGQAKQREGCYCAGRAAAQGPAGVSRGDPHPFFSVCTRATRTDGRPRGRRGGRERGKDGEGAAAGSGQIRVSACCPGAPTTGRPAPGTGCWRGPAASVELTPQRRDHRHDNRPDTLSLVAGAGAEV